MPRQLILIFLIAFALFAMQAAGGFFQIENYKKAVRRMHKLGNVGIGQTKGRFLTGNLVLIACDSRGVITGAEIMQGLTFLATFKPCHTFRGIPLAGESIDTFLAIFETYDKRERKRCKGYIQAIEALELRLRHPEALAEDAPAAAPVSEPA